MKEKPELPTHLDLVWSAFWFLANDRHSGMGISAILTPSIVSYLNEFEIEDPEDRRYYLQMIRAMDSAFLALHNEQREKTKKAGG